MNRIEDYFLIGDLQTAALVSSGGSIDWMCLPYFDSTSIFGRILDENGGTFSVEMPEYNVASSYVPETAIVSHKISNENRSFSVKDFMLPKPTSSCRTQLLVRKIEGLSGSGSVIFRFQPRPEYGKIAADMHQDGSRISFTSGEGRFILFLPTGTAISRSNGSFLLRIPIGEGESKQLILEHIKKGELSVHPRGDFEKETEEFWKDWVSKGRFIPESREKLVRSAITLKLMQFYPTGGIVAAPTMSLPEQIGGLRNWDYRYVWVRDSTFILYALYILGYVDEAMKFFSFIENVTEFDRESEHDIQLMYTIHGEHVPEETYLDHLSGYRNSKPVRVGNGAMEQFQLDTYGALIDAYYFVCSLGAELTDENKKMIRYLLTRIEHLWDEKDNGIWEVRSGKQHYTYCKVMCWVGVNRALKIHDKIGLKEHEVERYARLEKQIHEWIWENSYDKSQGILKQYPGTLHMDATNYLFVLFGFLKTSDEKTRKIIEKTANELVHSDVFVYRYFSEDGLQGTEGAFLLCTFWYISALAKICEVKKSAELFRKVEDLMNKQGLLAEEIDEKTHEYLGNYPQAFSHIGYIMSAYYIERNKKVSKDL
ncbi:glycoside hydrolase family 15 protein [Candidatus Roizmanbacteria bacterium]|nr:MAG: glycoside hydrolase family 15 protein [Candidatus Roizmanbacteria bacterium]